MSFSPDGHDVQIRVRIAPIQNQVTDLTSDPPGRRESQPLLLLEEDIDPGILVLTCANCGAAMDERKCKLICRCGYFLSCSDYY
jgi:hypothetical protein